MEHLVRLHQLWSWLPAFRAVAETEHLPTAAARLGVSAPALSRAIRLVENAVGAQLFERKNRRLVLNDAGRAMLAGVRNGMRQIDDGWAAATHPGLRGPLRIAVQSGAAGPRLADALERVAREHPDVVCQLVAVPTELVRGLLDGSIDLALVEHPPRDNALRIVRLGDIAMRVYCGRGSPLWRVRTPTRDQIEMQRFVVPGGDLDDGWPRDRSRRTGVVCSSLAMAVELCVRGPWLAALPESVEAMRSAADLRRLPMSPALRTAALFAVTRHPLPQAGPDKVGMMLGALTTAV